MIFILIPAIVVGYTALVASEKVTSKLVEKKNIENFMSKMQQEPDYKNAVFVPGKPRVYPTKIEKMIAEGELQSPMITPEMVLETIKEAELKAEEFSAIMPFNKIRQIQEHSKA